MSQSDAALSEREQAFERIRRKAGFLLAPALFLILWVAPLPGLSAEAHRLFAIIALVVVLWVTESIPLPMTALLGPALCVVAGIAPAREVFRGFGDPIIFLFLGGFVIAEAMMHHGLSKRIAFTILALEWVGKSPQRVLLAFGVATATISMWISNTATTAMMFPIALAMLSEMAAQRSRTTGAAVDFRTLQFGTALMLMATFASSVGGLATPVGTPPNLIGLGFIRDQLKVSLPFFQWMTFGLPIAALLVAFLVWYLNRACPAETGLLAGSSAWMREEKRKLGPLTSAERNVLLSFGTAVTLWLLPGFVAIIAGTASAEYRWLERHLPEGVSALIGASLLFILPLGGPGGGPTITWREAKRIDWGTILLFGGGLALGDLMFSTGLARWIGEGLAGLVNARSVVGLVILFTIVGALASETTSNAASANMVVPVAIAVAQAAGVDPLQPALAACLGSSMGFMLPVSTPPNAIAYSSGCIPLRKMIRFGIWLDVVGVIIIILAVLFIVPLVR